MMQSANYYQTIFDQAGDAIFIHELDSTAIIDVNQAAETLTGFKKTELRQMAVAEISANLERFGFKDALNLVKKTAHTGTLKFEWMIKSKQQQCIAVEVCLKRVHFEEDEKIIALVRDISEIKSYQYKLQSRDHYFQCLLESSADGIAIINPQMRLMYASPSLEKILGYRNRFALNKPVLSVIHPEDRTAVRTYFFRDSLPKQVNTLNFRIMHHNGQWHHLEATCNNMVHDPNIQGFIINFRDITERINAEDKARAREKQIGHMSRCKTMGELATSLAHELNQPLAALNNYVAGSIIRIEKGLMNTDETLAALNAAVQQTQRVGNIVRSMRNFLKKGEANYKIYPIRQIIKDIKPLIELKASQSEVKIHYEIAPQPLHIRADETLFGQVIINLIFNAVDALRNNALDDRHVYLRCWLSNKHVRISISDNGPGLNGINPDQLFESFYSSKADSMGIGLTLSRSIVENHHGYLWACDNKPGATFNISLNSYEASE